MGFPGLLPSSQDWTASLKTPSAWTSWWPTRWMARRRPGSSVKEDHGCIRRNAQVIKRLAAKSPTIGGFNMGKSIAKDFPLPCLISDAPFENGDSRLLGLTSICFSIGVDHPLSRLCVDYSIWILLIESSSYLDRRGEVLWSSSPLRKREGGDIQEPGRICSPVLRMAVDWERWTAIWALQKRCQWIFWSRVVGYGQLFASNCGDLGSIMLSQTGAGWGRVSNNNQGFNWLVLGKQQPWDSKQFA